MISELNNVHEQVQHEKKMYQNEKDNSLDEQGYTSSIETEIDQLLELDSVSSGSTKKRKRTEKSHEKKHSFCIQKSVFRSILKELLEGRSISEEAVQILHTTAENHMIDLFTKAKKIIDKSNRKTLTNDDLKLVLSLIK